MEVDEGNPIVIDDVDIPDRGMTNTEGEVLLPWIEKYRPKALEDLVAHEGTKYQYSFDHLKLFKISSVLFKN